ncbi:hypothetical protein ACFV4P_28770 [Kitasatospora sp. NPDC059795]|uniref:hypothetical protein n=1 Tax=Kitasatospora sp. NPDC059795 TaxID=3346949 RepID=UPI00364A0A4B
MSSFRSAASSLRRLYDHAALWSIGEVRAGAVVDAACEALVAGLDSPTLRVLAACTRAEADYEVPEILPAVFEELGLTLPPADSLAGREAAVRALAGRVEAGELAPWELAFRVHQRFGFDLPLAVRLAELDVEYGMVDSGGSRAASEIDVEVTAEAHRLAQYCGHIQGGHIEGGYLQGRSVRGRSVQGGASVEPDQDGVVGGGGGAEELRQRGEGVPGPLQ